MATPKTARLCASRSERTREGTQIEAKKISPPIVGVPALAWCSCGPSSRMCWPNSLTLRNSMNFGPRKMQISIAAMPAIRTSPIEQLLEGLGDGLEAGRAGALDEDRVARLELRREQLGRLLRRADQLVRPVVAGRLADADQQPNLGSPGAVADLAVKAGRAGAQLRHLAEDGDPPTVADRGKVAQRGAHRDWIGVVAVVHQDDPVADLEALAPEAGESYVPNAVGHIGERDVQGDPDGNGRQGVLQVVRLGERKIEGLAPAGSADQGMGDAFVDAALDRLHVAAGTKAEQVRRVAQMWLQRPRVHRDDRRSLARQRRQHLGLRRR